MIQPAALLTLTATPFASSPTAPLPIGIAPFGKVPNATFDLALAIPAATVPPALQPLAVTGKTVPSLPAMGGKEPGSVAIALPTPVTGASPEQFFEPSPSAFSNDTITFPSLSDRAAPKIAPGSALSPPSRTSAGSAPTAVGAIVVATLEEVSGDPVLFKASRTTSDTERHSEPLVSDGLALHASTSLSLPDAPAAPSQAETRNIASTKSIAFSNAPQIARSTRLPVEQTPLAPDDGSAVDEEAGDAARDPATGDTPTSADVTAAPAPMPAAQMPESTIVVAQPAPMSREPPSASAPIGAVQPEIGRNMSIGPAGASTVPVASLLPSSLLTTERHTSPNGQLPEVGRPAIEADGEPGVKSGNGPLQNPAAQPVARMSESALRTPTLPLPVEPRQLSDAIEAAGEPVTDPIDAPPFARAPLAPAKAAGTPTSMTQTSAAPATAPATTARPPNLSAATQPEQERKTAPLFQARVDDPQSITPRGASTPPSVGATSSLAAATTRTAVAAPSASPTPVAQPGVIAATPAISTDTIESTPLPNTASSVPATPQPIAAGSVATTVSLPVADATGAPLQTSAIVGDTPERARTGDTPALVALPASDVPPLVAGTTAPAFRLFAAAIHAARTDEAERLPGIAAGTAAAVEQPRAVPSIEGADGGSLDMADHRWPAAMVDRIDRLQEAAGAARDAAGTSIRLVPDALGTIDVAVRRDGGTVHVHFHAESAQTRALIAEAQPRLQDLAQERGLRLAQSDVGANTGGQAQRQPAPQPQGRSQSRSAPASTVRDDEPTTETIRVA